MREKDYKECKDDKDKETDLMVSLQSFLYLFPGRRSGRAFQGSWGQACRG